MPRRFATAALLAAAFLAGPVYAQPAANAGPPIPPLLPADHPFAEPILDSAARLTAQRASVFDDDGGQVLLLEGDVSIEIGVYFFTARRAVVRIDAQAKPGGTVRHLSIYLDDAQTRGGTSAIRASGERLLVTASTRGAFELEAVALTPLDSPPDDALVDEARQRIITYRTKLAAPLRDIPPAALADPDEAARRAQRRVDIDAQRRTIEIPEPGDEQFPRVDTELVQRPVLPARGSVRYQFDRAVYQIGDKEDAVMLIGNVRVIYEDEDEGRDVLLTAEKVVIFVRKEEQANGGGVPQQIDAGRIRGVYLEDNAIVSDGTSTVRAPRAFYDLALNRALLLEAVLYSVDPSQQVPLYMRADVLRQTSADAFSAENAVFTTSEFAQPHLAIGADKLTLTQREQADGFIDRRVSVQGATILSEGTELFYWPWLESPANVVPIRRIRAGYDGDTGPRLETTWDVFALAGKRAPEGVDLLANVDYLGEHGLGLGLELDYLRENMFGNARVYGLASDHGEDDIADRNDVAFDGDTRSMLLLQHRQQLPSDWELSLEGGYVSDPTLLEEFFEDEAYASKPYETSAYLKKAQDDWALTALLKYDTNNFTPQLPTLLTPGYTVDKLPEVGYFRNGTSVFDDRATWYSESRVGQVRARFGDDSPGDRGFTAAQSLATFGTPAATSFNAAAVAAGFPTGTVGRLDTRNELALPLRAGAVDITPYIVGRITAYDTDFTGFRGENDQARFWGGGGIDLSTEFSKPLPEFSSSLLDLDGLRHIVEPHATLALYGASLESEDLPIYDPSVEQLAEGGVLKFGMTQTLQTRRGKGLQQRTVDWLTVTTDVILRSDDAQTATAIPRYFDHRPEYALGGDHFYGELLWAVTEATAVTGELTQSLESGDAVQWRLGIENRHDDHLTTFVNYREIDVIAARLLTYGATLKLTTKYRVGVSHVIDFEAGQSRALNFSLERRIPRARVELVLSYDELENNTSLGILFTPDGFGSRGGILQR